MFLVILFDLALWLVAVGLAVYGLVYAVFGRRPGVGLCLTALIVLITVVGWFTPVGYTTGAAFRLWRHEGDYLRQVRAIASGGSSALGRSVSVEPGPPLRVAFAWGGMLDNWVGVVHDPSAVVANPSAARDWFGGQLFRAEHLWGDWYLCCFT
jgi:hypothetical protein